MATVSRNPLIAFVQRFASRLRYPQLFGLVALLLLVDLIIPDPILFLDEALLALVTLLLGSLRERGGKEEEPRVEKNVTPKDGRSQDGP